MIPGCKEENTKQPCIYMARVGTIHVDFSILDLNEERRYKKSSEPRNYAKRFLGLYNPEDIEICNIQSPCLVWVGGFTLK